MAQQRFAALGFHLTPRGHHSLGSSNHLAILGQDYIELLGIEPGRESARMDMLQHPPGLAGLAFKPGDRAFAETLQARGVAIEPAREFHRPVELPGGAQDARFRTANLTDGRIANGRLFFCYHDTPELVWREEWRGHANTATGLAEFVIAARDPDRTAGLFRDVFGAGSVQAASVGFVLPAGSAVISVLTPSAVADRFGPAAPVQADGSDRMVALGVQVSDLTAASRCAGQPASNGRVVVRHEDACGLALIFQT